MANDNLYQLYYGDLYDNYKDRYDELYEKKDKLSDFEKGMLQAYWEILDSMNTRADIIADILADVEE